jgi:hypothetical protein
MIAFGFSVTATMDAFGAGMIPIGDDVALDVTAAFLTLGWLAFLTFAFAVDLTTFFTAGFLATVFLAATGFFFVTVAFFTGFFVVVFFFVVAILTS